MSQRSHRSDGPVHLEAAAYEAAVRGDREFAAALFALAAPFLRGSVERFIDVDGRGIDFPGMLKGEGGWSTTERAMIEVACTLWGREDIADARLSPLLYSMDGGNFRRVVDAMHMRRGELHA
jgi:hypothetical protein